MAVSSYVPSFERQHSSDLSQRPNALADIHYAAAIEPESNTPSEDEAKETQGLYTSEDAQGVIGLSIGHAQTRLKSPNTPAAEKATALEDVEGGGLFGQSWVPPTVDEREPSPERKGDIPGQGESDASDALETVPIQSKVDDSRGRLPSPWRAEPKTVQRPDDTKQTLRESLSGRRRALSGGSTVESFKKLFPLNLPSLPKSPSFLNFSLPSFASFGLDGNEAATRMPYTKSSNRSESPCGPHERHSPAQARRRIGSGDLQTLQRRSIFEPASSLPPDDGGSISRDTLLPPKHGDHSQRPPLRGQHPVLRKSASYDSMLLYRSLSRASSLGDDTRFENVQKQMNARFKAIKDSWQDTSFKLPTLPKSSNFSFTQLGSDSSGRTSHRSSISRLGPNRRSIGNMADLGRGSSKRGSSTTLDQLSGQTGTPSRQSTSQATFTETINEITGDLVILGGYRGSVLREAKYPHRQLWAPIKIGLNLRDVNLEVGLDPEDDETQEEHIIPAGMLKNIGPIDITRRLFKRLRHSENVRNGTLRVLDFGYDWRLNPNVLSRKLIDFLETLKCNQPGIPENQRGATVLAHSLGGLVTRHAVNQRPDLFAGVVYAGVPQTCINILGPLRNGEDVLLSSKILTAQANFTMRTSFALLPLDGRCFFDKHTKEEYPVDFFDVQNWIDCRLSPVLGPALPALNSASSGGGFTGIINSMASVLPNIPVLNRRGSMNKGNTSSGESSAKDVASKIHTAAEEVPSAASVNPQMQRPNIANAILHGSNQTDSPLTTVTIPRDAAISYLKHTLASVKQFKTDLAYNEAHHLENRYPPCAVIYGKSVPTVYGAKVNGRDGIRRVDCYDELAFASGDGVVLAKAAMLPDGYQAVKGGVISSDRGHIGLLGDLEAVGRALRAVSAARRKGVGYGLDPKSVDVRVSEAKQQLASQS